MVGISQIALAALSLSMPIAARHQRHRWSSSSAPTATGLLSATAASATAAAAVTSTATTLVEKVTTASSTTSALVEKASTTTALAQEATTGSVDVASVFKPGVTWDICIHYPIKHDTVDDIIPVEVKVWDIDMGHARDYPTLIPTLKVRSSHYQTISWFSVLTSKQKAGKFVICYFNAGAVQTWDTDKDAFPPSAVGKSLSYPYDDEESYVDVRDATVVSIMKARLDEAAKLGCDAVDPDNVDAWAQDGEDPTGFSLTSSDYVTYLTTLAAYAHGLATAEGNGLLVGQKNAPEIADQLSSTLDFAVLEGCRGSSDGNGDGAFCADFQTYVSKGKPVLQIEYPPSVSASGGTLSASDEAYYCDAQTGDEGFSKVLKWASAQLDGWGQYCGGEAFKTPEAEDE